MKASMGPRVQEEMGFLGHVEQVCRGRGMRAYPESYPSMSGG